MAKTVQERSAKTARKRVALAEEESRLRVRPGTRQALADLMEWSGITEQGRGDDADDSSPACAGLESYIPA